MEKNYYEILEVDKNASKEIIDKAYKKISSGFTDARGKRTKRGNDEKSQ